MSNRIRSIIKNSAGFIVIIFCITFFRTAIADWNFVPSDSMEPNLYDGDWVWVDKTAYGPTLPFANIQLLPSGSPTRGDVITFVPPHTDSLFVKRVVGVPGDLIRISGHDIQVNDKKIPYKTLHVSATNRIGTEKIGHRTYHVQHASAGRLPLSNTTFIVPEKKYFVLGDNRTNSADSRVWGFVDEESVMGKVTHVAFSISAKRLLSDRFAISL